MLDAIVDILGGTIGNLVIGIVQVIISLICTFFVSCLAAIAELFLEAMAITPTQIETWLGAPLTTGSFAELITYSGIAIAMLFALWELCRGMMASIQGENPPTRPYVVAVRFLIFGAWSFGGIAFSKVIFDIGSRIYQSVPFDSTTNGLMADVMNFGETFAVGIGSWVANSAATIFGQVSWASSLVGRILTTVLIAFAMIGFLKLLFTCSQRYVNMIFYTYFSPLAIACGVSSSWSKVTWTWLKTLLSTLVLWVLDVWCIFGGLNLLRASTRAMANQADLIGALSCLLVTYGFMKGAIALDGIMSQFGATVTKTTGSLMGDMRDIMVMGHIAGSAAKGASRFAQGLSTGLTRGSGLANASNMKNLGLDKMNQGAARSKFETLRDGLVAAAGNTRTGGAMLSAANAVAGMPKKMRDVAQEARAAKLGREKMNFAKDVGNLTSKYTGKTGVVGQGKGANLPKKGTAESAAYGKELQSLFDKYGEKGLSLKDLTNDPNIMQDMAKNTLLDPKHPELGSMEDNGFRCVGYNPGKNGVGKATFDKYDANGNLQERREVGHLRYGEVGQTAAKGKTLGNGMFAGSPAKQMFSGDVSSLKFTENNGGAQVDVNGADAKGRPINKSLSAVHGPNLDGSQPVMVTTKDGAGMPVSQSEYTLKPGKTVRDGAEALASGKYDSAFVTTKNPKTGEVTPVIRNETEANAGARAVSSNYQALSNANGPITFNGKTLGGIGGGIAGDKFFVNAGAPDSEGNIPLAAVKANDPTQVVARGSISQSDLEAAYTGNDDAMNNAMAKAFANTESTSVSQGAPDAPVVHEAPVVHDAPAAPTAQEMPNPHDTVTATPAPVVNTPAPNEEMPVGGVEEAAPTAAPAAVTGGSPVVNNPQPADVAQDVARMAEQPVSTATVTATPEIRVSDQMDTSPQSVDVNVTTNETAKVEKTTHDSSEKGLPFELLDNTSMTEEHTSTKEDEDEHGKQSGYGRNGKNGHGFHKNGKQTDSKKQRHDRGNHNK